MSADCLVDCAALLDRPGIARAQSIADICACRMRHRRASNPPSLPSRARCAIGCSPRPAATPEQTTLPMQLSFSPPARPVPAWSAPLAAPATARHTGAGQGWATVQTSIRFGNLEVRPTERQLLLDGQPAPVGGRAFDLLMALIERRDRVVTKDELFALVWPGLVVEENNLQVHISALRKLLGPQAIVTLPGRGYRLTLRPDGDAAVPADALAAVAAAGMVTYLFTDIEGSSRLWEEHPQAMAQALARHDALCRELIEQHNGQVVKQTGDGVHAIFHQASEAITMAVAMQIALAESTIEPRLQVGVGLNCGSDEFRNGDFYGPAVNRAARVTTAAHGEQVLVTQAVVDALRGQLPVGIALRDLGNVRLRDLSSPERLHQVLHAQLRTEFPALRSLEATPNNLPQQLNSFIGREQELDELRALLKQHRLVTLLAMGGIGKSRLAVQLGAQVLDDFPDGVWLVELAPVTEPAAVTQAVARVLGVREEPGTPLIDSLLRHTRDRKLLVLLDNCEQVISACAELAKTLLQATTGLSILATSRDPLSIAGENCLPLRPLAVPNPKESVPEQLLRIPAARLFVDRARAVRPDFKVDATNAQAVAQICHRLDGTALALELAAARVRVMTADAIAAGLDQRFKLLVSGDRTALPRQKTLHALIQWSYDLLEPLEARLFERLSVFAAGWALDAAEEVCGFAPIERAEVLDLLAGLVQKSLVLMEAETGRFRMLETVRAFGHERLLASAERDDVAPRHAQWCVALTEAAFPELMGPNAPAWLQRLDAEHENVMAALQWSLPQAGQVEPAERLVFRMRSYWITRGLLGLAVRFAETLLLNPALANHPQVHCRALSCAGQLLFFAWQNARARVRLVNALSVARQHGLADRYRQVLQPLGMACLGDGDLAAAREHLNEGLALAEGADNPRELAGAVNAKAMLLRVEGALEEALEACRRVVDLLHDADIERLTIGRLNLAMVLIGLRRLDEADIQLRQALEAARQLHTVTLCKSLFEVCCGRASHLGDAERAANLYGAAVSLSESTGLTRDRADDAFLRPLLEIARSKLGSARFFELSEAGRSMPVADALNLEESVLLRGAQEAAPSPA